MNLTLYEFKQAEGDLNGVCTENRNGLQLNHPNNVNLFDSIVIKKIWLPNNRINLPYKTCIVDTIQKFHSNLSLSNY